MDVSALKLALESKQTCTGREMTRLFVFLLSQKTCIFCYLALAYGVESGVKTQNISPDNLIFCQTLGESCLDFLSGTQAWQGLSCCIVSVVLFQFFI